MMDNSRNLITHVIKAYNFFFKPRLTKECITVTRAELEIIIRQDYTRQTGKELAGNLQLPDSSFVLPTDDMVKKVYHTYFVPFLAAFDIHYEKAYDCDNFALTFAATYTMLKMGLAVGFIFYADPGKNIYHAVGCYVNNEKKLKLVEPQFSFFGSSELNKDQYAWFIYLQGLL